MAIIKTIQLPSSSTPYEIQDQYSVHINTTAEQTMQGSLTAAISTTGDVAYRTTNSEISVGLRVDNDTAGIYNYNNNTWPLTISTGGLVNLNGTANAATLDGNGHIISSYYVSVNGSTMNGNLYVTKRVPRVVLTNNSETAGYADVDVVNAIGNMNMRVTETNAGLYLDANWHPRGSAGYLISVSSTGVTQLLGRTVTSGTTGQIRGIVVGTAAATTANTANGDIYLRYS